MGQRTRTRQNFTEGTGLILGQGNLQERGMTERPRPDTGVDGELVTKDLIPR